MGVSIDISNFAVWSIVLLVLGSIVGNISHIVKKHVQEGNGSELRAFQKWVIGRPFTTVSAVIVGISAALAVSPPIATDGSLGELVRLFVQSAALGWTADSAINRAGNGTMAKKDPDTV